MGSEMCIRDSLSKVQFHALSGGKIVNCGGSRPSPWREGLSGEVAVLEGEQGRLASGHPVVLKSTGTGKSEACGQCGS